MKIKTSESSGISLDWAVAKCEGLNPYISYGYPAIRKGGFIQNIPSYSSDWSQGGPIIERERISTQQESPFWMAAIGDVYDCPLYGDTLLEAAMRCYVASRLGEEVEVPDELINEE